MLGWGGLWSRRFVVLQSGNRSSFIGISARAFVFTTNYFVSLKHSDGRTEMKPYWAWQEVNANTLSKDLAFMATQDWTAKVTRELNYVIDFWTINYNVFVHHLGLDQLNWSASVLLSAVRVKRSQMNRHTARLSQTDTEPQLPISSS